MRPKPHENHPETTSRLSTMEILHGLQEATAHLNPNSEGGAHSEVFAFQEDLLQERLQHWIRIQGGDPEARANEIEVFAHELSQRFLLKVGNIDLFVMRLGAKDEARLERGHMSEIFGKVGYNLHPSFDKTVQDATEACREMPYFSSGEALAQFAGAIPDAVRDFVSGKIQRLPHGDERGIFLVYDVDARRELSVFEILKEDPYFPAPLSQFGELQALQERIRKDPLDRATEQRLRNFFSAPITVGVRDTLRWLLGSRHPRINWDDAREIILDCFRKHGHENFLLPEMNLYAPSTRHTLEELESLNENNQEVAQLFARELKKELPLKISRKMGSALTTTVAEQVLRHHHEYPSFPVEPVSGYINWSTARLLSRIVVGFTSHVMEWDFPNRTNIDVAAALYRRGLLETLRGTLDTRELTTTLRVLQELLFRYMFHRGVRLPNGERKRYEQILTTFYSFQGRADYVPPGEKKLHQVSLEDLAKPEHAYLLREFPELAEKLVVFFVLVLRFYLDTDFIPDLRPDEAGINIFILGIWGAITENVIVLITEDEAGEVHIRVQFVDNKDHFKAYRRAVDRDQPLGLAKHALRIVGPVVEPAMLRAVGQFVEITWENRAGLNPPRRDLADSIERLIDIFGEVVLQGMDETQAHMRAVVEDSLDDTSRAVSSLVRKMLKKNDGPQPKGPPIQKSAANLEPR